MIFGSKIKYNNSIGVVKITKRLLLLLPFYLYYFDLFINAKNWLFNKKKSSFFYVFLFGFYFVHFFSLTVNDHSKSGSFSCVITFLPTWQFFTVHFSFKKKTFLCLFEKEAEKKSLNFFDCFLKRIKYNKKQKNMNLVAISATK